ncbi:MFS transporter [Novosphingobium rosa]|uniref:MFS transporter n=1 Tax=Novosphingobium rosa TaxID=76978 RepID=UPI00082A3CCE|nr:glycoside-pentoside-hexuronide (GPH):cation symporter [Novosphingobium rosa]
MAKGGLLSMGSQVQDSRVKTSFSEVFGYGMGDFASNLIWTTTLTYIVFYYTDIYGIPAGDVATILLVCRVLSAVIDPAVGALVDRRHGSEQARPFLIWGALPLAITTMLAFVPVGHSLAVKIGWAIFTFLALTVAYSFVNTAYGMLVNLMTNDKSERLTLTSARMIGANIGAAFIGWITLRGVAFFGGGDQGKGFMLFMGVVGLVAAGCFVVTWSICREKLRVASAQSVHASAPWRTLLANRPWMMLTLIKFCNSSANTLSLGSLTFASIYLLKLGAEFSGTLIAALTGASFLGCWLAAPLTKRLGKRGSVRLTNVGQAFCFVLLAVLPASANLTLVLIAIIGLMIGIRDPLTYAMLSDTLDPGVSKAGVSAMGLGYSIASAAYKVAAGVGGALSAGLLALGGYTAGAAQQNPAALHAILIGFAVLPAVILLLSGLVTFIYPSDAQMDALKSGYKPAA